MFDLGGDFESFVNVARYRTWSKAGMMTATAPRAWAVASTTAGEGRMTARARANPGEGSRAPAGGRHETAEPAYEAAPKTLDHSCYV